MNSYSGIGKGKLPQIRKGKRERGQMAHAEANRKRFKFFTDAWDTVNTAGTHCQNTIEPIAVKIDVIPFPDARYDPVEIPSIQKVQNKIDENRDLVTMNAMKVFEWFNKRSEYFFTFRKNTQRFNATTTVTALDHMRVSYVKNCYYPFNRTILIKIN